MRLSDAWSLDDETANAKIVQAHSMQNPFAPLDILPQQMVTCHTRITADAAGFRNLGFDNADWQCYL